MSNIPIISVTGTKGKTTTVAIIDDILRQFDYNVLKVDTTGHFVNGKRKSSLEDSKETWDLVPSVCPGRYLYEFYVNPDLRDKGVALLECSLGSSAISGLGYRYHDIGIFLNVFEDHMGSSDRIKSKKDIVKAKQFIFQRLHKQGSYAVFNADDAYVTSALGTIPNGSESAELIPVGFNFEHFDIDKHLKEGGVAITVNSNKEIILRSSTKDQLIADLRLIKWTFDGNFTPSIWNLMSAIGALYGYFKGQLPNGFKQAVERVQLDSYGGRLTVLKSKKGVMIIADYAHEKISLSYVAKLAHSQTSKTGQVIGVVRLAHDRTDKLMIDTGKAIASEYDTLVVYDKIDGYYRKALVKKLKFAQIEGRTSKILSDSIRTINPNVKRIVREDRAIEYAEKISKPGDVVVVIVNDNIKRSIDFIKDIFKAEFV